MSSASMLRRLEALEKLNEQNTPTPEAGAHQRFDEAIKRPGVMDRLWRIAEEGATDNDLEWLEQCTKETGFDFHAAVAACVKLSEEY
jgi:hypothetical protein